MSERLHLVISFDEFKNGINELVNEGSELSNLPDTNESEFEEKRKKVNEWVGKAMNYLGSSFNINDNTVKEDFRSTNPNLPYIAGSYSFKFLVNNLKETIKVKQHCLWGAVKVLSICDAIINPDSVDLEKASNYTTDEKLGLLLTKLYAVNDEWFYPVKDILEGNGVIFKRANEDWELAKLLEQSDYIKTMGGLGMPCMAQITLEGQRIVEQHNEKTKTKNMEEEIVVFISHGGSHLWKDVARFIERELSLETVVLQERPNKGRTVITKLQEEASECDFAIIVMTAEDAQEDGTLRARQNVIHEIGFCQGLFGMENVLILKQKGVEGFSNISGIVYEEFAGDNIKSTFEKIRQEIEELEEELFEEDDE